MKCFMDDSGNLITGQDSILENCYNHLASTSKTLNSEEIQFWTS